MFISLKNFFITFLTFALLFALWEFIGRYPVEYRFLLPPISSILTRIWEASDLFLDNTKVTLREMAGGFSLALAVAFPFGWIMYLWKSARTILQPIFIIVQSIPMFTLAPILVFWFNWSYIAIVIPTALMIFLPLTMNVYQGLASTPPSLLEFFKFNQATHWQIFLKLQLPWSLPHIFAGFRVAAAFAGIGAIAGEWAGAQSGLGVLMLKSRRVMDLETTFGALFCLIIMSMSLYGVILYAEQRYSQKKPMKLFSLGIVFCLLGIAAWSPNSNNAPHSDIQMTRLLLDWFPNSNHVPIYAGMEKGIFEKHHIQLQVLEPNDSSNTIPYLTSGMADIALFYLPDIISNVSRGMNLKIAGVLIDRPLNSFIFRADRGIRLPQDLIDKVIGYSVAGSSFSILERLLRQNHIVPKEMKNANFDLVTLLATDQVDVIYGAFWNIEGGHLKSLGIPTSYFEVSHLGHPDYSELVFVGMGAPETYNSFKAAMQESIDFCKGNPDEAFNLYVKYHPEKNSSTLAWEKEAWLKTVPVLSKTQEVPEDEWNNLQEWLKLDFSPE